MDYMQYLNLVNQKSKVPPDLRFLVSGVDAQVRRAVGEQIIDACRKGRKTLFLVDNTPNAAELTNFAGYHVANVLKGELSLCSDLLNPSSVLQVSRLRALLADLGFDSVRAMKVVTYLTFVRETEKRLGNPDRLTVQTLQEYGGTRLVEWKLGQLVREGRMTQDNCDYLLERYYEISAAAADFELFLVLLEPFLDGICQPNWDTAVHLPVGELKEDASMQDVMCKLMLSYVKQHRNDCAILILDDGMGDAKCISELLKVVPKATEIHMLTNDAFAFDEATLNAIMNTFPVRVYSKHESMKSCKVIEDLCGTVEVVEYAYTTAVDRRLRANSPWDLLMGTNYTETETRNAPVPKPKYRKEMINRLSNGVGIVDYGGQRVLCPFNERRNFE